MALRQDPRVQPKPKKRVAKKQDVEQKPKTKAKPHKKVFTDWAMI